MMTGDRADKVHRPHPLSPLFLSPSVPSPLHLQASTDSWSWVGLCGGTLATPTRSRVFPFPPNLYNNLPLIRITEDLAEQSSVKEVVLAHYVTLVEVFKHYASIGSALATGEIDIMEASVTRSFCCRSLRVDVRRLTVPVSPRSSSRVLRD